MRSLGSSISVYSFLPTCRDGESDHTRLSRFCSVWVFYVGLFGNLIVLGLLYWKRHSFPANFIFLSTFTLLEALTVGVVVAFYETTIVVQALLITVGVFLGLTLFTFQSKVRLLCLLPLGTKTDAY